MTESHIPRTPPVRFAIVGTGLIAGFHAKAIADCAHGCLTAVYDAVPDRARAFAEETGVSAASSLDELLSREDVDAITIATPSGTHGAIALPAARAGKHVLCEKPLEITTERIDEMIATCREHGVQLGAILPARTAPGVALIRKALDAGRFGRLIFANVELKWYRSQAYYESSGWRGTWALDGGGALMNQGIHQIDLMLHFAGDAESVFAYTDTRTHPGVEVEDSAVVVVRFVGGALGTIVASTCCEPGFPRRVEITGERGHVVLQDDILVKWAFTKELPGDLEIQAAAAEGRQGGAGAGDPANISYAGHLTQIDDFARAIRTGAEPMITGVEGRRSVALICAAYESSREKREVRLQVR